MCDQTVPCACTLEKRAKARTEHIERHETLSRLAYDLYKNAAITDDEMYLLFGQAERESPPALSGGRVVSTSNQHQVLSDVRNALAAPRGDAGVDARMLALDSVQRLEEQLETAQERLSQIRSLTDEEWAVFMREHDVLHEARRLSRSIGVINTTRHLDRALERYDEAVAAERAANRAGERP